MKDYSLKINGHNYDVQIDDVNESSTLAHVVVNGVEFEVEIEGAKAAKTSKPQEAHATKSATSAMFTPATAAPSHRLTASAPTPGYAVQRPLHASLLAVKVNVGDRVTTGQTLVVLEAMKMENNIDADRGGVVKEISVQQGATVMEGDNLIVIE